MALSLCPCSVSIQYIMVCIVFLHCSCSHLGLTNGLRCPGSTALFSHRPKMKIIKKIMHRRPKKHRPSDINHRSVNHNKCITKVPNAPPEYILLSEEEFMAKHQSASNFWETGDPEAAWHEITEEDMIPVINNNMEPPPPGDKKRVLEFMSSLKRSRGKL